VTPGAVRLARAGVASLTPLTLALLALAALAFPAPAVAQFIIQRPSDIFTLDTAEVREVRRAPMTLTPSLTVTEEFNDNIFLDNRNKEWDFITGFTPGIAFEMERPTYHLVTSYDFTAEIFARNSEEDHAFDRQNFFLNGTYRVNPQLTLTGTNTFTFSTDTNMIAAEGVSTGRSNAWSNDLGAGVAWQVDPRTSLRAGVGWTTQHFQDPALVDSNAFTVELGVERALVPRLRGILEYQFDYFAFSTLPDVQAHTPRVGAVYEVTPTLTAALRIGPTFEVSDGSTDVVPSVLASLRQRMRWGVIGFDYSHLVGTAGGLGGTTRNHSIGGTVQVTTLLRGLFIAVAPRISIINGQGTTEDVTSFTLPLQVVYRITERIALVGAYQFFHQNASARVVTSAGTAVATDVDQNRLLIGIQFGYPIRFD